MARRATKDTYGIEKTGPDMEVRRLVKAGDMIPPTYSVESGDFEEVPDAAVQTTAFGHRTPPPDHLVESRTTQTFGHTSLAGAEGLDEGGTAGPSDPVSPSTQSAAEEQLVQEADEESDKDKKRTSRK